MLAALVATGRYSLVGLLAVATAGNVLGSVVNWLIGRELERHRNSRWFPFSDRTVARAQTFYARYGRWTLLLSWMPIIGDPLTLVAGALRERLLVFLVLVIIAKLGRYVFVAALAGSMFSA